MRLSVDVDTSGPLFRGRYAQARAAAACRRIGEEVADRGLSNVQRNLDTSIRNPTPYYETQITVQNLGDRWVVHDRGIVYGPWLEGTGSRNRTTRFKGYHSFARATAELHGQAQFIADHVIVRLTAELNA
jgi:hypothetical protein